MRAARAAVYTYVRTCRRVSLAYVAVPGAMAVHSVTLSSEQAAILMPVLQQLSANSAPTAPTIQLGSNEATVSGSATGADGPS